jgi:hypothetical protein
MRIVLWAAIMIAGGACAARPGPPIPVHGDVAVLEGQWVGEYSSTESGRHGSIVFTLRAGQDPAYGDVIMITAALYADSGDAGATPARLRRYQPEMLAIRFVQVSGNQVMGDLAVYRDPECGCYLSTTFSGKRSGEVIEGTFLSYHSSDQHTVGGRWRATRTGRP